ncbi:phenylacetate--CoA ligase family protein [Streptomyces sp. DH12]|uniref:phenylacetate--CoA ligase family protein n=1 Tax=Streptomyces sp. DH12 TaxID=2857010 RepID=UPI001E44868D|nr:phenylacetate--CoA ligase family protein [Streptomyces sp. DH12]
MDLWRTAVEETAAVAGVPADDFYTRKLGALWSRARAAPAYRHLGPFSPEAFAALPLTRREDLKARPLHFATVAPGGALRYYETTGSTGRPTPTPRLAEDVVWNTVAVAEAWRSVLDDDERVLSLLPSDVVPVGDLVAQVADYLDLSHLRGYPFASGITGWDRIVELWRAYRPTTVFLAPGVALEWTRLAAGRGTLPGLRADLRRLMLLGEVNTPPFRDRLGRWWEAAVHDASYGSTETGTLATTCPAGGQHLLTGSAYVELDTGGPHGVVPVGPASGGPRTGQLVVTPLNAHARPLLRLATGDVVTLGRDCPCGRSAPTVTVHGRESDTLRLQGAALTPRDVEGLVFAHAEATGYLVEVDEAGTYAGLLLERLPGAGREGEPAAAEAVRAATKERFGLSWDRVVFVNALPRLTKSGASQKSWKRSNIRVLETAP